MKSQDDFVCSLSSALDGFFGKDVSEQLDELLAVLSPKAFAPNRVVFQGLVCFPSFK